MISQEKTFEYHKLNFDDIDQSFTKQWSELLNRAIEPIAYMDPNYVLPAEKYLKQKNLIVRAVYSTKEQKSRLVGLGIFTLRLGDKRLPFPHLQAYKTEHSFLSGLVIDRSERDSVIEFLFNSLAKEYWYLAGIRFIDYPVNDVVAEKIGLVSGIEWFEFWGYERAVYVLPDQVDEQNWCKDISKKRLKNYRKAKRELESLGEISWRYVSGEHITQGVIDDFLKIEHSGWKGEEGTSLLSDKNHVDFFKSLVTRFNNEGKIFFTELYLEDKLIAATCNLILNDKAFAFKIGWDIDYKQYSVGVINEVEFLQYADREKCSFSVIESGAVESSFIESYWKQRWYLSEGIYSLNLFSKYLNLYNNKLRSVVKAIIAKIKKSNIEQND